MVTPRWMERARRGAGHALSTVTLAGLTACGSVAAEPGRAVTASTTEEVLPPTPSGEATPCPGGIWRGGDLPTVDYLGCVTDEDCVVVQWGQECQSTATYGRAHAACVALSPVCPEPAEPTEARCNDEGRCELALW